MSKPMLASAQKRHPLSPAERTAKLLAFRGPTGNFGAKIISQECADKTAKIIGRNNWMRTQ